MEHDYSGFHAEYATFECALEVSEGQLVCMHDSGKIAPSVGGNYPIGIARQVRDGYATVQVRGYVKAKHDGTLGLGYKHIVTVDPTKVKRDNVNGIMVQVLDCTEDEVGILF